MRRESCETQEAASGNFEAGTGLYSHGGDDDAGQSRLTSADFYNVARSVLEARRLRDDFVGDTLRDPAWDMLLTLYCAERHGELIGSTDLSLRARVPLTTGLRYLRDLDDAGFVERDNVEGGDRRKNVFKLTGRAKRALEVYFQPLSRVSLKSI